MNLHTALRVTVILGWAGLVVEMARTNPWVVTITSAALLLGWFSRSR